MAGNILVVTEDTSLTQELQRRLPALGYPVVGVCTSIAEALRLFEKSPPGVVLIKFPKKIGIDVKNLEIGGVAIVLVVNAGRDGASLLEDRGHAYPVIEFPVSDEQLGKGIESAIDGNALTSEPGMNRRQLQEVLNSIDDGIMIMKPGGTIQFINPVAQKLTGWDQNEAIGKAFSEVFVIGADGNGSNPATTSLGDIQERIAHGTNSEILLQTKGGGRVPVEVLGSSTALTDGTVLLFRDNSSRRQAIDEIHRQARRAQSLAQTASLLNADLDLNHVLVSICNLMNDMVNASVTSIFLYDRTRDLFTRVTSISQSGLPALQEDSVTLPAGEIEPLLTPVDRIKFYDRNSGLSKTLIRKLMGMKDATKMVLVGIFRQENLMGFLNMMFINPSDTGLYDTELIQGIADQAAISITNASLFDQVRQGRRRQHALAQSLVTIQEAERRSIARELHDHLGQSLTGLQFMLEREKKERPRGRSAGIEEMQMFVVDLIEQIRELSHRLRPSMLDDLGLRPTLLWHVERYTRQTGIFVHLQCDDFPNRFSTEIETTAYRIVQEALTNVARYAGVKEVHVDVRVDDDKMWVEIVDKGNGFDFEAIRQKPSSGLGGMRERVDLVGGKLLIRSYVGQGTQIVASLPLADRPVERRKGRRA
jgi:PAS domain S-box-containing protein